MAGFTRDPRHWLYRFSPDEWIRAGLGELARAEAALDRGAVRAGVIGVKRAAGMALNAVLIVEPERALGRTYLEHLAAVCEDASVPEGVRDACRRVLDAKPPEGDVIHLRTPRSRSSMVDAARDVIAHAWAVTKKHEGSEPA